MNRSSLLLRLAAARVEQAGDFDLSYRMYRVARQVEAASEVELESWTDFESWFLKNRSQGLEFVFADKYGDDSQPTALVKEIVEAYDFVERKLHDLYSMLKTMSAPTQAPMVNDSADSADDLTLTDELVIDDTEPTTPEQESVEEEVAQAEDEAEVETGEPAESEATEETEEVTEEQSEEESSEEDEIAEEVLAPEASSDVKVTRKVERIRKMMVRAGVKNPVVSYRGENKFRIRVDASSADSAVSILTRSHTEYTTDIDPIGRVLIDVEI